MTNKIPVGQTIAKSYRFAYGGFPAVLGVVWLPILLSVAAGYFAFRDVHLPAFDISTPERAAQTGVMTEFVLLGPLRILELVLWVCTVVIEVGLTRLALGIGGKPFVFFTLGAPFWRMLGANLIFAVIIMIAVVPVVLAVIVLAVVTGAIAHGAELSQGWMDPAVGPWAIGAMVVVFIAGFVAFYYVYFRLWFFIAPVVIAERHIDLRHAWRLGKGNVLRMVAIVLAIMLPLLLILGVAEGFAFWLVVWTQPFGTLPDSQFFAAHWPELAAVGAVVALVWILAVALLQGARAFAYRAIVPAESPATPDGARVVGGPAPP